MTSVPPPVPTSASYTISINTIAVGFDVPLNAEPITGNTVTFRVNNIRRRGTAMNALGMIVSGNSVVVGADVGPDVVDYAPPPFDIREATVLRPAVAFADFPLGVIP